jgi:hypothetical protein
MKTKLCVMTLALSFIWPSLTVAQGSALIQAANEEGKVVWYTSLALSSSTGLGNAFQKKYKGIEVEVHRMSSERVLQRAMQETAAGKDFVSSMNLRA